MSRVLVVDDEEAYRTLMAGHLERKGMTVVTAKDGLTALDCIQKEGPYDVVVTDMMMPNMSGLDLLREIKQREPGTEVIIITASNEVGKAVEAMREGGAFDYMLKPLESIGELSLTVGRALQHRQLLQDRQRLHEELDREASRLQALVTFSSEAMLLADGEGCITIANPAAAELTGRDDLVGAMMQDVLPLELRMLVESWQEVGRKAASVVEIEWPEGSTHMVSLAPVGNPLPDHQSGWVMIVRDITHLKQIDELKLRMLSDTAAKIRLPLAQAVTKLAQLAAGGIEGEDARTSTIYQLATVLGKIQEWMDELFSLVQVEAGVGFYTETLNFDLVFTDKLQTRFEERYRTKNLTLIVQTAGPLPFVSVDPKLFDRMLDGLLERAAQRSQVGGEVGLSARAQQDQVWIEISDQGLPSGRKPGEAGDWGMDALPQGFNLQMVRAIVQKLGGQVWVQGQNGIGSTIAITLPAIEGETRS